MKFGAAKEVTTEFSGWVDWTVEAHVTYEVAPYDVRFVCVKDKK